MFAVGGLAQMAPWGAPTVVRYSTATETYSGAELSSPTFTYVTELFERDFVGQVKVLATDESFNWIISAPKSSYNMPKYFTCELALQLLTATLMLGVQILTINLDIVSRKQLSLLVSVLMSLVHLSQLNWWGTTLRFALGMAFNVIVSSAIGSVILDWTLTGYRRDHLMKKAS